MKIIQLPDPILRKKANPVITLTPKIISLIKEMEKILREQNDPPGVGLAAPQVGVSLRIFLIMPPSPTEVFTKADSPSLQEDLKSRSTEQSPSNVIASEAKQSPQEFIELFINPQIISSKGIYEEKDKKNATLEGCLSLHKYYGPVTRANEITIEYSTISLGDLNKLSHLSSLPTPITKTFTGFPAVIIQHEVDHLMGKLFVDRILEQHQKIYKACKNTQGQEILEEVVI